MTRYVELFLQPKSILSLTRRLIESWMYHQGNLQFLWKVKCPQFFVFSNLWPDRQSEVRTAALLEERQGCQGTLAVGL